jgi:uncharacterized membrane protein
VALLIALHVLAVVVWVGGMFFAYLVLRPSAGALQSEARLALWHRVFGRFFPFVWMSVIVMQGLGIVMIMLFLHLYFTPWQRFNTSVERSDFVEAAKQLGQIRCIVGINLVLGLVTIVIGASGRFW